MMAVAAPSSTTAPKTAIAWRSVCGRKPPRSVDRGASCQLRDPKVHAHRTRCGDDLFLPHVEKICACADAASSACHAHSTILAQGHVETLGNASGIVASRLAA